MKELYEIQLHMKKEKISKRELSELTGFAYSSIRRMFRGKMTLQEADQIKSALNIQ